MEKSVREVDRVLMVCSDIYVQKANGGKGGVGYEAMMLTGELIRDLGTAKFIPIMRQNATPPNLPASVSTRFYVDLSRPDEFDEQFDRLLRELHQAPLTPKPALGANPFAVDSATLWISCPRSACFTQPRDLGKYARCRYYSNGKSLERRYVQRALVLSR